MRPVSYTQNVKPAVPVVEVLPTANFTLVRTGTDSLNAEIDVATGSVYLKTILSGWLYVRGNDIDVEIAHLNDDGVPVYYNPMYSAWLHNNPQVMPLPAVIKYIFPSALAADAMLRRYLEDYIAAQQVIHINHSLVIAIDNAGIRYDISADAPADVVTDILQHGHALYIQPGASLYEIPTGVAVTISVQDFKCYSALDQPLNLLDFALAAGETVAHIYHPMECAGTTSNAGAHDYLADLDTTSFPGKKWLYHNDFNAQTKAVVHTQGSATREIFVDFDKYEKYAIFPSNIDWYVKNWCISGVYDSVDRSSMFVIELLTTGIPANLPYNTGRTTTITSYPTAGTNITPPTLNFKSYNDGEAHGEAMMNYIGFSVNHLKFYVRRNTGSDTFSVTRSALFPPNTDPAHAPQDTTHGFTLFHYEGAAGFEEYVKRVASSEYNFGGTNFGKEGLKAQILATRTYTLFHLLDGNHSLTNPITLNYAEQRVIETTSFQVHTIDRFNAFMRTNAKRLALEEAMAETWGLVATFRGRLIDAEYFAGSALVRSTIDVATKDYCRSVHTSDGANAASVQAVVGHGRGYSQNGARNLAKLTPELNHLQIMHWFYFGIQMRNGYGLGDIITNPPANTAAGGWVITNPQPVIPSDALYTPTSADWAAINVTDDNNWYISHHFTAKEYCKDAAGANVTNLNISKGAVLAVQFIRFYYNKSMVIKAVTDVNTVVIQIKANSAAHLVPLVTDMTNALTDAGAALNAPVNFVAVQGAGSASGGWHYADWSIQV